MNLAAIEDITPYDIYSTLTVRDSVPAKHIQMISELLLETLLDDDKPDRLTVSQPPRTAKSSLITLSFPFWLILMNPTLNILIVNYSQGLADDFGMILRQLFIDNQKLLAERNIYLSDREHAKSKFRFENKDGQLLGSIKLVGVGGPITGRDVDICICDDLIKGFSDCTPTLLDKLYSWYQNILIPRLEPWSKLFMLGTRWHSQDVIGRLMTEQPDKYHFVTLQALNDDGSCIWGNRYTPDFFEERRKEVGDRVFEAQYQGRPLDLTGEFFDLDYLQYNKQPQEVTATIRAYDMAYSESGDYTVGILAYKDDEDNFYIQDMVRGQYGNRNKKVVQETAAHDGEDTPIGIEYGVGAAAKLIADEWSTLLNNYTVKEIIPIKAKEDRAFPLSNAILDGKVICNLKGKAREQFLQEFIAFPEGKHDDIVDATAHCYNMLFRTKKKNINAAIIEF